MLQRASFGFTDRFVDQDQVSRHLFVFFVTKIFSPKIQGDQARFSSSEHAGAFERRLGNTTNGTLPA